MDVDEKIYFYKKDRERIGGEHDRLMLLDLPEDFGVSEEEFGRVLDDIRDFARGSLRDDPITEPMLVDWPVEGTGIRFLHWMIDDDKHFYAWLEIFRDVCLILGLLGSTQSTVEDEDHEVIRQRSKQCLVERDKAGMTSRLGMTLKQGLDREGWDALYRKYYLQ
jgi:hypothetical protein